MYEDEMLFFYKYSSGVFKPQAYNTEDEYIARVLEALKNDASLRSVQLQHQLLGELSIEKLAEILKITKTLVSMNLSNNNLSSSDAGKLAEALKKNTSLKLLDISFTRIGLYGIEKILDALSIPQQLNSVNLEHVKITVEGAKKLASSLKINTNLKEINIAETSIDDECTKYLAEALMLNETLEKLNLESNISIEEAGGVALAKALAVNKTLRDLNLQECKSLGRVAMSALSDALKNNQGLLSINLACTNIDNNVLAKLANALTFNTTLKFIDLSFNRITDKGIDELIKCLEKNITITDIKLLDTYLSRENEAKIRSLLWRNADICHELERIEFNVLQLTHIILPTIQTKMQLEKKTSITNIDSLNLGNLKGIIRNIRTIIKGFSNEYLPRIFVPLKEDLETNILNYFALPEKTSQDYENLLNLFLLMPQVDEDLLNILGRCAGAYCFGETRASQLESKDVPEENFDSLYASPKAIMKKIDRFSALLDSEKVDQELLDKIKAKFFPTNLKTDSVLSSLSYFKKENNAMDAASSTATDSARYKQHAV